MTQIRRSKARRSGREGTAMVMMTFTAASLAGLSATLLCLSRSGASELRGAKETIHARYVAEAGVHAAVFAIENGDTGDLGTEQVPVAWGDANFWVERADIDLPATTDDLIRLTSTGAQDRAATRLEVVLEPNRTTIFQWAAFGDEFLSMDSNAQIDSYDSSLNPGVNSYTSQAVNGSGSTLHAEETGDVGSNGAVLAEQNVKVWGDASAGPGSTTTVLGNAQVAGSTAPMLEPMEMPPITVPSILPQLPFTNILLNTTFPSGNYNFMGLRISTGKVLTVNGPANIVVGSFQIKSGAQFLVDATNGPVEIWVIDDFLINSNTLIASTTYNPFDIKINLLSDNVINPENVVDLDEIDFDSNAKMYGTIYAPSAAIEVDSNFELFGAMVARSIDLDSNAKIHYDTTLASQPGPGTLTYQAVSWRVLPLD
jgi:hypothetical protein